MDDNGECLHNLMLEEYNYEENADFAHDTDQ